MYFLSLGNHSQYSQDHHNIDTADYQHNLNLRIMYPHQRKLHSPAHNHYKQDACCFQANIFHSRSSPSHFADLLPGCLLPLEQVE